MKRNRIHAALLCAALLLSSGAQVQADTDVPAKVVGDLTGDGVMNNVDVIVMQKYILGRLMLPQTLIAELDFNDDGKVNAFDLAVLKRWVAQQGFGENV
ncbi:MAG: dockerin type I repeat-containing protein [Oscillospiraceae bacterium]|nr:dockerin type I repeat-containing protein [Oscillospiraceae bacterium]